MRCVILGGAGFIGSHLTDRLLRDGHSIRVFDLPNISRRNLDGIRGEVNLVGGDFANPKDLAVALDDMDVVIHLVCTTLPGPSNENPTYDIESNVLSTIRLLELCVAKGVKRVLFASSGGTVYGIPREIPISEAHPTHPICSYGITKLCIENYLSLFHHLYGMDFTVFRFGNPYGEKQRYDGVQGAVAVFLGKTISGKEIDIWGDGSVSRDYIYIGDLVDAVASSIENDVHSKIYNIGSGISHSLNDIISLIRDITGTSPSVNYLPSRRLDVPMTCLDISRARRELAWVPKVSMREGIARLWKWMQRK